jgi:hypothetical protein
MELVQRAPKSKRLLKSLQARSMCNSHKCLRRATRDFTGCFGDLHLEGANTHFTWPLGRRNKMIRFLAGFCAAVTFLFGTSTLPAQQESAAPMRAPATPLVVHDTYFSIWSAADRLTDGPTTHWSATPHWVAGDLDVDHSQPLNGLVHVDQKNYQYLGFGYGRDGVSAMEETARQITPTRTIVTMQCAEIELTITFLTPAFLHDMRIMARPVTYLTWEVKSRDGSPHKVALYLDASGDIATNDPDEAVVWSRAEIEGLHLLRLGTSKQAVLERYGDNLRINWGYFYIAVPAAEGNSELAAGNRSYLKRFLATGHIPQGDDLSQPRAPQSFNPPAPMLNLVLPLGAVGATTVSRHVLLGYDDIYSLEYMRQKLLPYWRKEFSDFSQLLEGAERGYAALREQAVGFDAELLHDLVQAGGSEYAAIAALAFRQAVGAHKLVEDADGIPFFMPKENFSDGNISTVDVLYPSAPMFLLLNPKLVEAQMEPVMRYASSNRWKFPFAPHDLGFYPLANGALAESSEGEQMPVEESGNLILMAAAIAHAEHDTGFASRFWPLLTKWAEYLLANGLDPEDQLCTDDFTGRLAHNANLSIKAIEALAAYSQLAKMRGDDSGAARYREAAQSMANKWVQMTQDGTHSRLAFDKPGTWSQKYNLVWDNILGLHLFPPELADREVSFYKAHLNRYGLPLDNRATYTKLDWTLWSATLARDPSDFQAIVHPVFLFLNETADRVPLTDFYDTVSAHKVDFQARSVVGGVYIKLLADSQLWSKWVARAARIPTDAEPAPDKSR